MHLVLALSLIANSAVLTNANVASGANAIEFGALCALARLAEVTPQVTKPPPEFISEYQKLININMSVAADNWTQIFSGKEETQDAAKIKTDTKVDQATADDWKHRYNYWVRAAKALNEDQTTKELLATAKFNALTGNSRKLAQAKIKAIAAKGERLKNQAQATIDRMNALDAAALKESVRKAVYGERSQGTTFDKAHAFKGYTTNKARDDACTATGVADSANTVAATLICLCLKKQGATGQICRVDGAQAQDWQDQTNDPEAQDWAEIIGECPQRTATTSIEETINHALRALENRVILKSGTAFIGALTGSTCTGAAAAGVCVKIPNYAAAGKNNFANLQWVAELGRVAMQLKQNQEDSKTISSFLAALKEEAEAAIAVPQEAVATEATRASLQEQKQLAGSTKKSAEDKEKECNAAGDEKAACDNLKDKECVFNKDGGAGKKCTLNKEAKQAAENEANQEGGAKPGVNCSSHTTKETCEAVTGTPPTGKAKVCGWIEGKCRDSSFLVYKKFALSVVSAAL
uniref:Variant surface glycoprotein 1125.161 n=1 Tax=Trypanosoma brucei TaxID=5691 RepID=A0A1J0R5A5_9TRYP|nr:variant surface glycoprotein 1125.161 [Trypanosoma brucei]